MPPCTVVRRQSHMTKPGIYWLRHNAGGVYFAGQDDVNNAAYSIVPYNIQRVSAHGRRRRDVLVLSRDFGLARSGTVSFVGRIRCKNWR